MRRPSICTLRAPGTDVQLDLTNGQPNRILFLALGDDVGDTVFNFGPLGSLQLGLDSPVQYAVIGVTDSNGALSLSATIPPNFPLFEFKAQAVSVTRTMSFVPGVIPDGIPRVTLDFCTSNVVDLKIGS